MSQALLQEALRVASEVIRLQWALQQVEDTAIRRLDQVESRLEKVEGRLDQAEGRMAKTRAGERIRQTARLIWPPAWKLGAIVLLLNHGFDADEIRNLISMLLK